MKKQILAKLSAKSIGLTLGIFLTNSAFADNHLNCQVYAQSVIDQVTEAAALGCGFVGDRWSANYSSHFNWCNTSANIAGLTREDNARKNAIVQCKKKKNATQARPANAPTQLECRNYANQMVQLAAKNNAEGCGLTGGRYSSNYDGHYNWCYNGATRKKVSSELQSAGKQIGQCVTAKNTKTFEPLIGFTTTDGKKRKIAYNVCDRKKASGRKCWKGVADAICRQEGFKRSTAHKTGKIFVPDQFVGSYYMASREAQYGTSTVFESVTCVR